jgi:UDP-N-acetylglucosamine 1-carboxyvinyltransferase
VPLEFSGLNRIPILLLGPLLHRNHEAFVPLVGGDRIGRRPVDFHIAALEAMGVDVDVTPDGIAARADRLRGARITLPYPSVGATETVLLSAVQAEGRTVLVNAAVEPEVTELALFLQRMGARISFRPDRRIVVEGVDHLRGAATRLQGDRLEAFSYLVAGLMTGGRVRVAGCAQDRLVTAIDTLQKMGARFEITDEWISASADDGLSTAAVQTDTHPGFMTDWQPELVVLMTQAEGMSVLHETVYEDRLVYVDALTQMGCEIELYDTCLGGPACRFHDTNAVHSAVVRGVSKLHGAEVTIPDVRAGFASAIAAAVAEGPSLLHGIQHLERGYNRPFETLESLGLRLERVPAVD